MNTTEEKDQQINDLIKVASSIRDDQGVIGTGTALKIDTRLTHGRSADVLAAQGAVIG